MNKSLILVRGVPGCGKTTFSYLIESFKDIVISTDMFFEDKDGNYKYDADKIGEAHGWCLDHTELNMKEGINKIIINNTFTREYEMALYYDLAKKYEYQVFSVIVENRHGGVNVHGVPDNTVQAMKDRFEIKLL